MPTDTPPAGSTAARLAASTPGTLAAAADEAAAAARTGIARVTSGTLAPEAMLDAYDEAVAALRDVADVADLVARVHPDPAMRAAGEAAAQRMERRRTDIELDREVYDALATLDLPAADPATRHWLARVRRDFRRAGVDRDDATRARVRELRDALVETGQAFVRTIDSDTRSARFPATALAGMPDDWVRAHPPGDDGMVTVTTDGPDVVPFLTYSADATARERLLRIWRQRGHPANIEVLARLRELRHELATLLGYPSWAAYATEERMIGSQQAAADFIDDISRLAADRMARDYADLLARKRADDPAASAVEPWDRWHLAEQVRAERYGLDSQRLRPYFEYGRVRDGLMAVASRLFGIEFAARPDLPVWHPEVAAYDVSEGGTLLGRIFLDMHPRPDKFSHAAMYTMVTGKAGRRVPECALLCNLPRPGELLQHSEVETFFHEFGHLLHHIFGGHQRWAGVSGIATERDFIEVPSLLLEEWTSDAATLATFAVHHGTGEPLPAELVELLRAANEFGKGLWVGQQMFYSALSLELYRGDPAALDPATAERETQRRHTPFPPMDQTAIHLSFGHLDGYSACYYTYIWSLVIAKDLFTGFDHDDLLDPGAPARYRRQVLARGGSAPAAELVRDFLGRDYTVAAYRAWLDREPTPAPAGPGPR
jgi:thimet oligopeptidase